jgi:hypothetical protein
VANANSSFSKRLKVDMGIELNPVISADGNTIAEAAVQLFIFFSFIDKNDIKIPQPAGG